jgi:CHASE2 domain-containing sensor protein
MTPSVQAIAGDRQRGFAADARFIGFGLLVGLLLVLVKIALEISPFGLWAEKQVYSLLVEQMPKFSRKGPDVAIVDIAHIKGGDNPATGTLEPSSRGALLELLEALALERPLAIGLDIDFSPTPEGWVSSEDPAFLERCLEINARGIPVRLGIYRTMREPREAWLGTPKYAPLAASLWLPTEDTRRLPRDMTVEGSYDRLLILGAALAQAVSPAPEERWHAFLTQAVIERTRIFEPNTPAIRTTDVLINYSRHDQIMREMLPMATPADVVKHRDKLRGKILLIGDGHAPSGKDMFPVPNEEINHAPGVMLHASLANTMFREPLYELTHAARLLIDVLILLVVLIAIVITKRRTRRQTPRQAQAIELRVIRWTVLAVVVAGFSLVIYFQVLWLDFLLVCFFLLIHTRVEQWFHALIHRGAMSKSHERTSS